MTQTPHRLLASGLAGRLEFCLQSKHSGPGPSVEPRCSLHSGHTLRLRAVNSSPKPPRRFCFGRVLGLGLVAVACSMAAPLLALLEKECGAPRAAAMPLFGALA